jgi:hypothetical protein
MARLCKELFADVARKVPVDSKIEPLEHIADESGKRSPQSRLFGNWYVCHVLLDTECDPADGRPPGRLDVVSSGRGAKSGRADVEKSGLPNNRVRKECAKNPKPR